MIEHNNEHTIKTDKISYQEISDPVVRAITPLVSVHMITYNHELYIAEAIEGILHQKTDFPFELVIGEDCSKDRTREIVMNYQIQHPEIIRVITSKKNVGMTENHFRTTQACRGKYTAYCEGDDYWHSPYKLQKQIDIFEKDDGVSLVASDADALFMKNERYIRSLMRRTGQLEVMPDDMTKALLNRNICLITCTVCFRSELFLNIIKANPYEYSAYFPMSDVQTWWEFSRRGRIHIVPESLATYRVLDSSVSHSENPEKVFDFYLKSLELHEHYVSKFDYDNTVLHAVRRAHYSLFADISLRTRSEALRIRALNTIHQVPRGMSLRDQIILWGIKKQTRFLLLSSVWPALSLAFRAAHRGHHIFKQCFNKMARIVHNDA